MDSTSEGKRLAYYDSSFSIDKTRISDPNKHTMGASAFRRYIGRDGKDAHEIQSKKFSEKQSELLAFAYKNSLPIRVIGAYRGDLPFLLKKRNATLIGEPIEHTKNKQFNCLRQVVAKIEVNDSGKNKKEEVWVICFPSKQYVNQNAELIAAIISDFSSNSENKKSTDIVTAEHYHALETKIAEWTDFEDFASLYVRHGDVVCIGNVELFTDGIKQYSFSPIFPEFQYGGLGGMFGSQILINNHRRSRTVLIGFKESFWGDASAQYVKGLLNIGATHVLYGSKAASMVDKHDVHRTYAPQRFMLLGEDGRSVSVEIPKGKIGDFIENFNINHTGTSITVPTVIGESYEQYDAIRRLGPTCMDCENGHIASVLEKYNNDQSGSRDKLRSHEFISNFLPLHFITDYIYGAHENPSESKGDLGIHAEESTEYSKLRKESFTRIGNAFASYSLMFGLEETISHIKSVSADSDVDEETFEEVFTNIRPLLDAGLGKEALAQLSAGTPENHPLVRAIVQVMICQKHGYTSAAHSGLERLRAPGTWKRIPQEAKTRLHVIALKLFSQTGSKERMREEISHLFSENNTNHLARIRQFGAAKRRQAIYHSLLNEFSAAEYCIDEAANHKNDHDAHYSATNALFLEISKLPTAETRKKEQVSNSLAKIRREYLSGEDGAEWWQTNFQKCATATLFLEAAYCLCARKYRTEMLETGMKILTIAHLHNMRLGGNERSEAYGEIVKCTPDPLVRNILSLAMRDDNQAHEKFHNWIHSNFESLSLEIRNYASTLRHPINESEKIHWFINNS